MPKNELCGLSSQKTKNTGNSGNECIEKVMTNIAVAKSAFRFLSLADAKNKVKWAEAVAAKDIVPLYDTYNVAAANQEAKKFETGNFSVETEQAVKKTTFESYLGLCSHSALSSFEGSDYTQVFEFNQDGTVVAVYDTDGIKIKGQNLKNFNVGIRNISTDAKPAFSKVEMVYEDYKELEQNYCVMLPTFTANDIQGIFDVVLEKVSNIATLIKVRASMECSGGKITTFLAANFVVRNGAGVVQTIASASYNAADDTYDIVGTGFATGFTVALNGVVTVVSAATSYEAVNVITL